MPNKSSGKGKRERKRKDISVGVGSTYADAGRPKTLKPTEQDRQHTGNLAEYFLSANKTTAQPLAPVFASGPHSATASAAVPSTQMTALITGYSTEVSVLVPWWLQQQTSWTGPDPFPAKRMQLVCDNASVHKADELKTLMEKYGIIIMLLPPNMTQWLQPLDRVVCGLIQTVQRAR